MFKARWLVSSAFLTMAAISFSVLQTQRTPDQRETTSGQTEIPGITPRRLFEQQADDWLRRAHRSDESLAFVLLEVQNLDQMNIALGSDFGDRAIQTVGWVTRDNVPTTSLVGRVASRRFVVLTATPSVGGARAVAERVMTALAENPIDEIEGVRAIAEFGVATTADEGYDYAQLARSAAAGLGSNEQGRTRPPATA